MFKIALALLVILLTAASDAMSGTTVIIRQSRPGLVMPLYSYQAAAPAPTADGTVVPAAPAVVYSHSYSALSVGVWRTPAERWHARQAARHARWAARHAARSAYHASRS